MPPPGSGGSTGSVGSVGARSNVPCVVEFTESVRPATSKYVQPSFCVSEPIDPFAWMPAFFAAIAQASVADSFAVPERPCDAVLLDET